MKRPDIHLDRVYGIIHQWRVCIEAALLGNTKPLEAELQALHDGGIPSGCHALTAADKGRQYRFREEKPDWVEEK